MLRSSKPIEKESTVHDVQIQNQIFFVKLLQQKIRNLLEKYLNGDLVKDELHEIKKQFKLLHNKCEQIIVLLQLLIKLNNEVALARLELARAVKLGVKVEAAQKRVKWLEKRLKNFKSVSRTLCHIDHQERTSEENSFKMKEADLSATFVESLTDAQKQRLFSSEFDEENADGISNQKKKINRDVEKIFMLTTLSDDISSSSEDEEGTNVDRTREEGNPSEISDFKEGLKNSTLSFAPETSNMTDEYWNSDHHRFEWTNFMQTQDPLSWHALAISYPDTFLKRGMSKFESDQIPWRVDRDLSEGSAFTKKSIEKVHQKLQSLLQAIEDAAVNSVKVEAAKEATPIRQSRSVRGKKDLKRATEDEKGKLEGFPPLAQSPNLDYYDERRSKLFSRPVSVVLPVVNKITGKQYPRNPKHWCDLDKVDIPSHSSYLRGPKQPLKDVPTISKRKTHSNIGSRNDHGCLSLQKAANKVRALTRLKPRTELTHEQDDLKWTRILELLGKNGIQSEYQETSIDAFRALSRLNVSEAEVIDGIREKIKQETNPCVIYEACKCLMTLGTWDPSSVRVLRKALENGNKSLQLDILSAISDAKDAHFVTKEKKEIKNLIGTLTKLASSLDEDIALGASLALGHLCVAETAARHHLYVRLEDPSFSVRDKVLHALVRQMNCKDIVVIDSLLFQISNAKNWKQRISAAELLQYIGVRDATKEEPDKVFDFLEKLLWNHPSIDLRRKIAEVITDFGMRPKAMFLVYKRLDDLNESIRLNAIQMLSSLRMKGEKELKTLLDILELDSSLNVRIQVLHAFASLKWNDPRIIRSLQEREKGDGFLAKEAASVLDVLAQNNIAEKIP